MKLSPETCLNWPECCCSGECDDDRRRFRGWALFVVIATMAAWAVIFAALWLALSVGRVHAHQAPSGWAYPYLCCSDRDCTEVPAERVKEGPEGYRVTLIPGDHDFISSSVSFLVPYSEAKDSPDGEYHICINEALEMLCFFAGARGY